MYKNILFIMFSAWLLTACQSTQHKSLGQYANESLYLDHAFDGFESVPIESVEEIFAIDDAMRQMIAKKVAPERDLKRKSVKLLKQIFHENHTNIIYRTGANLTAIQAYHQKQANCLSLTIMAYALAKEAGLSVTFQDVKIPEYWVRNGHLNMLTGHVNLRINRPHENKLVLLNRGDLEIDFDPFVVKKSFPKVDIDKNTVVAMFYNNKAANAMVSGEYSKAYAYIKAATKMAPSFSPAWGNLAVLYRFNNFDQLAIKGYRHAIAVDSANLTALENLSLVLHRTGERKEAQLIDSLLIQKRLKNPYYYALLADEKYYDGFYQQARQYYKKAIKLDANIHEFYFGLAKVYYQMKQYERAQNYLKKAIKNNHSDSIEQQYLAKLQLLNTTK